ncbi:MAG: hypothetical protein AB7G75_26250 [Candidatus Binatia bacterium]
MNVTTRSPQFAVTFITEHRGTFTVTDTHDSLLSIDVQRQLGHACGAFQLTMAPRPIEGSPSGAWWDILSPQDFCEIRIWVPPAKAFQPVMRGFIDTVSLHANYGARGQRVVSIAGRDYGKLFLNTRLYYPTEEVQQAALFQRWQHAYKDLFGDLHGAPPERPSMSPNQTDDGPNFSPSDLHRAIFEGFYQPMEEEFLATFEGAVRPPAMALALRVGSDPWEAHLRAFSPTFFQKSMAPWTELHVLMYAYQHRPWRELFIVEDIDSPTLVYRPSPWLTKEGEWVQGAPGGTLHTWDIADEQIVSLTLSRSDAQALNYFLTYPELYGALAQMAKATGDLEGVFEGPLRKNPYLSGFADAGVTLPSGGDTFASRYQRFGFRIAEFSTPYLSMNRGLKREAVQRKIADLTEQGVEGTRRLYQAFDHNHLLQDGTIVLRGDDRIQIGDYLRLTDRGNARYYVESVRQDFRVGTQTGDGHFLTHCTVSRGRGHLVDHYGLP